MKMNASAEPEKQSQYKPNLSLPKGDQTQFYPAIALAKADSNRRFLGYFPFGNCGFLS